MSMSNIFQWRLHGDGKTLAPGEVVEPDERLTWVRTAGIGAQHVIAMFGATFLVPILTGFDPSTTLFFTAMSTALFLLINRNVLPSYLGSSFGFIAPITAVTTANKGIAVASFGIMVTGILLALIGVLVHYAGSTWIDIIMPPVVNGAIVAIIGFNLAPSVWTNFQAAPDTALVTLLAVLLVAVLFKGLLGRLNILVGVIIGYVYACIRGQVDFSAIGDAAWIGFPKFHLPQADFSILPMFIPVVLVLVAENVGHVKSVAQMTGRDYDNQIGTALMADGLGTTLAGFGGGSGHHHLRREHRRDGCHQGVLHRRLLVRSRLRPDPEPVPEVRRRDQHDPRRRARRRDHAAVRHDRHDRHPHLGGKQGQLRQAAEHHGGSYHHDYCHRPVRLRYRRRLLQRHRHRHDGDSCGLPRPEGHWQGNRHYCQRRSGYFVVCFSATGPYCGSAFLHNGSYLHW